MFCDFKRCTEAAGLKIHPEKINIFSNNFSYQKKEVTISNIKAEVLPMHQFAKHLGQTITFQQQETIKSRIRTLGVVLHIHTKVVVNILPPATHVTLFQHLYLSDAGLRLWNLDLTCEHERMIRSTQHNMLRHIVQTRRRYKKKDDRQPETEKQTSRKKKKVRKTPKMKLKQEAVQTPIDTQTATSTLQKTQRKKLTQLNTNKNTVLNT